MNDWGRMGGDAHQHIIQTSRSTPRTARRACDHRDVRGENEYTLDPVIASRLPPCSKCLQGRNRLGVRMPSYDPEIARADLAPGQQKLPF